MARTRRSKHGRRPTGPVLTGRGWMVLAAGLVSLGFGIWQHESAFVQIGLFTWVLVAGAWGLARRNLAGVEITRVAPAAVFVGELFPAVLQVSRGDRPGLTRACEVTDEFLGLLEEGASVRRLGRGQTVERTAEVRLRRRGVNPSFRWYLMSTFPGGLWRSIRSAREVVPITVFPRPVWPEHLQDPAAFIDEAEDGLLASPRREEGDYLGIREFAPGDPLKLVHWRATARAQRLVVREFDRQLPAGYALFFFSFLTPGESRWKDAFESALEMLTGLLLGCRSLNVPLTLAADFTSWRTIRLTASRDASEALMLLAEAQWSPSSELAPLAEKLAEVPAGCRIFIVSDTPLRHWAHLVPESPAEVTCLSVAEMRRRQPLLPLTLRT
jgi:uncharacterized protein (DUF58 family)